MARWYITKDRSSEHIRQPKKVLTTSSRSLLFWSRHWSCSVKKPATLLRVSCTGVFMWILRNFYENLYYRKTPDDCYTILCHLTKFQYQTFFTSQDINSILGGLFWGCSRMGGGPLTKICHNILQWWNSNEAVNVNKSVWNYRFGHVYWRNPSWKTSFFVQWHNFWFF